MNYQVWPATDPAEDPTLSVNLPIQAGDPLASASVAVSVLSGLDPNAAALTNGLCTVSGAKAMCAKSAGAGVDGTSYIFTFTGVTAAGKHVVGRVILPVVLGGAP